MSGKLQCYNKGCGAQYTLSENGPDACIYHPGEPFFHDAYKGWSCCNKKTVDFSEFLSTKGCTTGEHSNVKLPAPEKPKPTLTNDVTSYTPPIAKPKERPPEDTPLKKLNYTVGKSLETLLASAKPCAAPEAESNTDVIGPGTKCKHGGCDKAYENEESNNTICLHHPGTPIFHEGMKYWSCCQKKTSDFTNFLAQEGCTSGEHLWKKTKEMLAKEIKCRYDWHQTGKYVTVSIFAKGCNPKLTYVEASPVRLNAHLVFDNDINIFDLQVQLNGIINVEESNVNMLASKIEINLRKDEPMSWPKLHLPGAQS